MTAAGSLSTKLLNEAAGRQASLPLARPDLLLTRYAFLRKPQTFGVERLGEPCGGKLELEEIKFSARPFSEFLVQETHVTNGSS